MAVFKPVLLHSSARHGVALAASCCAALALCAGCRNLDNTQVDVLESQLRQQEDYIYELEDYLIEYSEKLRQARIAACQPSATATTKSTSGVSSKAPLQPTLDEDLPEPPRLPLNGRNKLTPPAGSSAPPADATTAPAFDATKPATPQETAPLPQPPADDAPETLKPEEMVAPELEIGSGAALPWKRNESLAQAPKLPPEPNGEATLLIPDPVDYEEDSDHPAQASLTPAVQSTVETPSEPVLAAPAVNSRLSPEKLHIRHIFSQPPSQKDNGPSCLQVVVEVLNSTGEPVDGAGEASLMIMSQDAPGSLHRLERWDFTTEETTAAWQSSGLGDGLHLELPLGETQLPEGELELWARLVTPTGQKLLTKRPFDARRLGSMEEAVKQAAATAAKPPEAESLNVGESPAATETNVVAAAAEEHSQAPQWRASSIKLAPGRVEGFATTANGTKGAWNSRPDGKSEPRIALAAESSSAKSSPTWKRSSAAATQSGAAQNWTPDR
jgi:hypothetical protein